MSSAECAGHKLTHLSPDSAKRNVVGCAVISALKTPSLPVGAASQSFLEKSQKSLKKVLTNKIHCGIISTSQGENTKSSQTVHSKLINGGIAQLARAIGSYPIGRGFKSNFRYHSDSPVLRPDGQAVKTPPFHGSNGGSIPPRVSNWGSLMARWSSG